MINRKQLLPFSMLLVVTLVLAAGAASAKTFNAGLPGQIFCERVPLESEPSVIADAVWLPEVSQIVLSDVRARKFVLRRASGSLLESIDYPLTPHTIARLGSGYLFATAPAQIEWLDRNLEFVSNADLRQEPASDWRLQHIWTRQLTSVESTIVGIGHLASTVDQDKAQYGVFAYEAPILESRLAGGSLETVYPFGSPLEGTDEKLFKMGMKFVTSVDTEVFFMAFDRGRPKLMGIDLASGEGAKQLEGISWLDELRIAPMPESGYENSEIAFDWLSNQDLPVGLLSQGGNLYLLRRTPVKDALQAEATTDLHTVWRAYRVATDLAAGEAVAEGVTVLPTGSEHTYILPTPNDWLVFEAGKIHGKVLYQNFSSMLRVNTRAFETSMRGAEQAVTASDLTRCR